MRSLRRKCWIFLWRKKLLGLTQSTGMNILLIYQIKGWLEIYFVLYFPSKEGNIWSVTRIEFAIFCCMVAHFSRSTWKSGNYGAIRLDCDCNRNGKISKFTVASRRLSSSVIATISCSPTQKESPSYQIIPNSVINFCQ